MELEEFKNNVPPIPKHEIKETSESIFDKAVNPKLYTETSLECIDTMVIIFGNYIVSQHCLATSFKYVWRCRNKNGLEDLYKSKWYLAKAVELDQDLLGDTQWMALTERTNKLIAQLTEENGKG